MTNRRLYEQLNEFLACALHYQEKGEPDCSNMTAAQIVAMWEPVPDVVKRRYWHEPKFHAQVDRATAAILEIIRRSPVEPSGQ